MQIEVFRRTSIERLADERDHSLRNREASRAAYPLEWDEQQRLLKELPEHLREMTLFMLHTGLRDQELCQLRWDWEVEVPELGEAVFILPASHSKNGEERVILLNRIAREVIERERGRHEERVFTFKNRCVQRMLNTAWQKARVRAGLPQLRVHDLRHTVGHRLRAAGVGLEDRKAILGHTNGDITTQYSVPSLVRLRSLVELIADHERASVPRIRGTAESKSGAKIGQKVGQKASLGEARPNG